MADGSRITCAHSVALALDIFLMFFFRSVPRSAPARLWGVVARGHQRSGQMGQISSESFRSLGKSNLSVKYAITVEDVKTH